MIQKQVSRSESGACDDDELLETEIHDVLRNDRRRMVLDALGDGDGSITVRELSEMIAAQEAGQDPPPRKVRESVYISLHQSHLPKLDDLDVVDYDDTTKQVAPSANAARVGGYMEGTPTAGPAAGEYWVPLTALAVVLAATAAVPGLDSVSAATGAALAFAAAALATAHEAYRFRGSLVHRLEQ